MGFLSSISRSLGDALSGIGDIFHYGDSVTDYFTGYTSANQAFRFGVDNMALQQQYNRENMALEDQYQRKLMADSPSIQRSALASAGYNPMLAISSGISSPSSAVNASMPSASTPSPNGFGLGDIINAVSSAFGNYTALAKLGGDVALTHAQADATRANSAADVALKTAEASKVLKEADSIDPKVRRQNDKYGNGLVGEGMRFVRTLADGLGSDIDVRVDTPLKDVSSNSAKGLDRAVKAVNSKVLPRMRHETKHGNVKRSNRRHN